MLYASGDPERKDEIWSILQAQMDALSASLTIDDLEKIRCKAATGVTLAGERPGGRMQRLGKQWLYQGHYTTLEEELERVNRVGVEDLREVLEAFASGPRTIGWMLPKG